MDRVIPKFDGHLRLAAAKQGQRWILVTCPSEDLKAQTAQPHAKTKLAGPYKNVRAHPGIGECSFNFMKSTRSREVLIQFYEEYKN